MGDGLAVAADHVDLFAFEAAGVDQFGHCIGQKKSGLGIQAGKCVGAQW